MEFNLKPIFKIDKEYFKDECNIKTFNKIKELNNMFLDETYKGNKVAYYYENIKNGNILSYNNEVCFYAASSIKILVCLIVLEKIKNGEMNLNDKILVTMNDLKQDTGIIKYQKQDTEYSLEDLIKLTIVESDNTAYLKLVEMIGKEKIKEYGLSIGAIHTMEGKSTDSFGLINCTDMIIYWKKVKEFIDNNQELGSMFKKYLLNPTFKIIEDSSINNQKYIRKYGSWDIAYHEAGYIDNEYYLIILTQLNKKDYKENFCNVAASKINDIHDEY